MLKVIKILCTFLICLFAFTPQSVHSQANDIEVLENQFQAQPDNYAVLNKLGDAYLKIGRNQDALKIFKKAKEMNPDDSDVRWKLALVYLRLKENNLSIEESKKSIELNPNHFMSHLVLADNLFLLKQNEQALKEYKLTLLLNPYLHCDLYLFLLLYMFFSLLKSPMFYKILFNISIFFLTLS